MKTRTLSLMLLLAGLGACIPETVDIEIPQAETRLVVASQMLGERGVIVNLSRSFAALDSSNTQSQDFLSRILVDSAIVTLTHGGVTDTLSGIGAGTYFTFDTELLENETYLLRAVDPDSSLEVMAESEVLPMAAWSLADYRFALDSTSFNGGFLVDTTLELTVSFGDLPGESYYMINLYKVTIPDSQSLAGIFTSGSGLPTQIYSDKLYPDPLIRDTIRYQGFVPGDTVALALSHISRGYYEFLSARQRSNNSIFVSLLKEPVNYTSNIVGGYGFFTLQVPTIRVFILE